MTQRLHAKGGHANRKHVEVGPRCNWDCYVGIGGAIDDNNSQGKVYSSPMEKHHTDFWWLGDSFS